MLLINFIILQITHTMNRKAIATVVGRSGTEPQERALAKLMTHSVDVARRPTNTPAP